jgi:hypothetical protein
MIIQSAQIKNFNVKETVDGAKVTKITIYTDEQVATLLDAIPPQTLVSVEIKVK